MSDFKRDKIKYIRDRAKARYQKGTNCFICDTTENLEFHHYYTLTPLFNKWVKTNKLTIDTEEQLLAIRDRFISEHEAELYEYTVTLCKDHHSQLHSVYGKDPPLHFAKKEMKWAKIQREKHGLPPEIGRAHV